MTITKEIYSLESAGIDCWDVRTKKGSYAGLIVTRKDGTFRHYYNGAATQGSAKKFPTLAEAIANIDKRRERAQAKRAA